MKNNFRFLLIISKVLQQNQLFFNNFKTTNNFNKLSSTFTMSYLRKLSDLQATYPNGKPRYSAVRPQGTPFTSKDENGVEKSGTYYKIYPKYMINDDPDAMAISENLQYQTPVLTSDALGLRVEVKNGKKGPYKTYTAHVYFDLTDPATVDFLQNGVPKLQTADAAIVDKYKGVVKIPHFNTANPEGTGLKPIIITKMDEETCLPIPGAKPEKYIKINSWTPIKRPSIVRDENGEIVMVKDEKTGQMKKKIELLPVPHDMLVGKRFTAQYIIEHTSLYSNGNGKASPQEHAASLVVFKIDEGAADIDQTQAAEEYVESHATEVAELEAKIAEFEALLAQQEALKNGNTIAAADVKGASTATDSEFLSGAADLQTPQGSSTVSPAQQVEQAQHSQPQIQHQPQPPSSQNTADVPQVQVQAQPPYSQPPQQSAQIQVKPPSSQGAVAVPQFPQQTPHVQIPQAQQVPVQVQQAPHQVPVQMNPPANMPMGDFSQL